MWTVLAASAHAGPGDELFSGCAREQPTPNDLALRCGARVVTFSTVSGVTPEALLPQVIQQLSKKVGAKIEDTPLRLSINGAEVGAHRFSAKAANGTPLMTSYFLERAVGDGKSQMVHCLALKADPAALEACKPTMDVLLTKGPPPPWTVNLEELFGHKVTFPPGCDVTPVEQQGGGRVRCGERLTLRWDPIPSTMGAAELDRFVTGMEPQFAATCRKLTREALKCHIRQVEGTCVRMTVDQANGQYIFLIGSSPVAGKGTHRLVLCGARSDDATSKGYCDELFSFP